MADRPIVVGVDGTTTALRAVAWAAKEAVLRGRPLRLVHAAPYLGTPDDPADRGRADAVLARARTVAHQIAPKLATDVVVLPDPPVSALIDASADADLLVIGMIGGSGAEIVLGSLTLDVTTGAHSPVAVVRGESTLDHPGRRTRPAPVRSASSPLVPTPPRSPSRSRTPTATAADGSSYRSLATRTTSA